MRLTSQILKRALALTILVCAAALPFVSEKPKYVPPAQTDFSAFDLNLKGTWEFAWGRFLTPQEALEAHVQGTLDTVYVPQKWAAHLPHDPDNPYHHGIATYVRAVSLPVDQTDQLILHIERMPEAYAAIWIPLGAPESATVIASEGNLTGPSQAAYVDLSHPMNVRGDGLLMLHVRKDILAWGGMFNPPHITTSAQDNINRKLQRIFDGFWTGCLFFAVFQNFYLFSLRRTDWAPLLLGNASLIVMLHLAASSNTMEVFFGTGVHALRTRIELFAVAAVGPILLMTIRYLIPPLVPTPVAVVFTVAGVLASGFVVFAPADMMSHYLYGYETLLILTFLVIGGGLAMAIRERKPGAITLILALVFIFTAAVHDIFASETGSTQFRMTAMAIFVFIALCSLFMGRKVSQAVSRSQMLEEEKQILQKLHSDAVDNARRDHLTGLLNRQAFDHEYSLAWRSAKERIEPLSVVLFDIDHFKRVNDTYGHPMGDRVLKVLADRLREFPLRRHDRVMRYGGEEFTLLLPNTLLEDAMTVAEKIRQEIAMSPVIDDPEFSLTVTCSFGIACTITASGCSPESLLQRADEALYASKHGGRNRVNGVYSLQHAPFPDITAA